MLVLALWRCVITDVSGVADTLVIQYTHLELHEDNIQETNMCRETYLGNQVAKKGSQKV